MNRQNHRFSAAVLALVLCLSFSPIAHAKLTRDYDFGFRERIVRIIERAQSFFGGITGNTDVLFPPRP